MTTETRGRKALPEERLKSEIVAVRLDRALLEKLDRMLARGQESSAWRRSSRAAILRELLERAPE